MAGLMKLPLDSCAVARSGLGDDDFVKHLACFLRVATLSRTAPFRVVVATLRRIPHQEELRDQMQFPVSNQLDERARKCVIISLSETDIEHGQTNFAKRG